MTRHDSRPTISRRKVLGGIGAVGLASAGAGLGTTAFFSDEETFEGNRLVAGEFDLKIDYTNRYYDGKTGTRGDPSSWELTGSYPSPYSVQTRDELAQDAYSTDFASLNETQQADIEAQFRAQFADDDDITAALVSLNDVKPGDEGCLTFSLHLFDNPGYIWLYAADLVSNENGLTEPERKDGDEQDGEASGELEDEILVSIFYDDNQNCTFDPGTTEVPGEQMIFGPGVGGFTDASGDQPATLAAAFDAMSRNNGFVPLDGDRSTRMGFDEGDTSENRDCFVNSTTQYVTMHWELPVDHANEVQTDSVEFDVGFYAEQCRHNTGAMMPRVASGSGDFSQVSYNKAFGMETLWGSSSYDDPTGQTPHEIKIHPAQSEAQAHHDFSPAGEQTVTVPFSATFDPTTATPSASFTVDGVALTDPDLTDDGVPAAGEVAITLKAQDDAGDLARVDNLVVDGTNLSPFEATFGGDSLVWVSVSGLDFSSAVTVSGDLTLAVDEANYDVNSYKASPGMGVDWR